MYTYILVNYKKRRKTEEHIHNSGKLSNEGEQKISHDEMKRDATLKLLAST